MIAQSKLITKVAIIIGNLTSKTDINEIVFFFRSNNEWCNIWLNAKCVIRPSVCFFLHTIFDGQFYEIYFDYMLII